MLNGWIITFATTMTKNNHKNRGWRARWVCEPVSRTAVHESGVTARVAPSAKNQDNETVTLENTAKLNLAKWDLGRLTTQAVELWMEGRF